jgi:Na+/H+ antiporter NhaD/arsenite permease-like protein
MIVLIIVVFIVGYLAIALEHPLKINKTGSALLMGVLIWTIYKLAFPEANVLLELGQHLIGITEILFFLMGAMTIVEVVDAHDGFNLITNRINTRNKLSLLWTISIIAFFLSAILDNLTTTIVMISLTRKLVTEQKQRLFFAGMIVIAANAGGAWSPIGDVTTTMLWIGGQVSALKIIAILFLPSLVCLMVPLLTVTFFYKKDFIGQLTLQENRKLNSENKLIFIIGLGGLLFVPAFKQLTHLPPYFGMLLVLGILWIVADLMHRKKETKEKQRLSASNALMRIDMPSLLFFLGILLAVSGLESLNILSNLAQWTDETIGNKDVIIMAIGLLSAIIDNVPLVAATMGMYNLNDFPMNHRIWEFIAYCAGTGGSILIIGSAAGVAAMGLEKIDFIWYLKKFSFLAALGYLAGALFYIFQTSLIA